MSSYHLSDLIINAAVKMGTLSVYKPSPIETAGGSKLLITDSSLALTADELIHGVAIVTFDAGGLGAAPEGEIVNITDNSTNTITISTLSANNGVGDEYMIIRPKYPLVEWIRGTNSILKSLGEVPLWDTSLTMTAGITEYNLPVTILEPAEIWRQTNTTTSDFEWERISGGVVQNAAPGTAKVLRLPSWEVVDGYKLGLVYYGDHPTVHDWDDHIDIPIELVAGKLAWHMINRGGLNAKNQTQASKILAELNDAQTKFKIPNKKPKAPKYLVY